MESLNRLIGPDVGALLDERRYDQVRNALVELEPADVADLIGGLDDEQGAVTFRLLPRDFAADVFSYFDADQQEVLIARMGTERLAVLINEMDPDDRTVLLEELPAEVANRLIALLTPSERSITQTILNYPEESVGRLMTPDYVRVRRSQTIGEAIEHIRRYGRDAETVNVIYVVDDHGHLIDDLRIRQILLADPAETVESIMDENFVALSVTDDREEAVRQIERYDRVALPVVDSRGVLLGIVTADDIADVAEEEVTEDIHKMGGMEALDAPYLESAFSSMVRKRAGWLSVLFVGQMLTAAAMGYFADEIERAVILALFLPLIISSGGNAGSQATSLVIRAMAVGEVELRDVWVVLRRELAAGLSLGLLLGAIGLLRVLIWPGGESAYGQHYVLLGMTLAFSTLAVVTFGTFAGSMLPFVLARLGLDPAAASAPFVATLVDVTGVVIYFTTAAVLLTGTIL